MVAAWDVLAAGGGRRTTACGGRTAAPSPAPGYAASAAAENAAGLGQMRSDGPGGSPGGRPPPGAGGKASRFQHRTEHAVPGLAGLLGLGNTTSQTGNPGWLINRDINATPTAGGR